MNNIEMLAEQIRKELVGNMDKNAIRVFIETNYPKLSTREKSQLVEVLTGTTIPDEGDGPV